MQNDDPLFDQENTASEQAKESLRVQSFNSRLEIEQNRKVIGAYKHSQLGSTFAHRKQFTENPRGSLNVSERDPSTQNVQRTPSESQRSNTQAKSTFNEPPGRTYNPYA